MKNVRDLNVKGLTVLVRCDFNVPLKDSVITDENRLNGALPTINYLIKKHKVFLYPMLPLAPCLV